MLFNDEVLTYDYRDVYYKFSSDEFEEFPEVKYIHNDWNYTLVKFENDELKADIKFYYYENKEHNDSRDNVLKHFKEICNSLRNKKYIIKRRYEMGDGNILYRASIRYYFSLESEFNFRVDIENKLEKYRDKNFALIYNECQFYKTLKNCNGDYDSLFGCKKAAEYLKANEKLIWQLDKDFWNLGRQIAREVRSIIYKLGSEEFDKNYLLGVGGNDYE